MQVVRARKAVISNASTWDTVPMIPTNDLPAELRSRADSTPQCDSFMHLHLGIDAKVIFSRKKCDIMSFFFMIELSSSHSLECEPLLITEACCR